MPTTPRIVLHFKVVRDEEQFFTAVCDEFPGLITCEQSLERLVIPMLQDAILGWFDALKKRGLLAETLIRFGVEPHAPVIDFTPVLTLVPAFGQAPVEFRYEPKRASA